MTHNASIHLNGKVAFITGANRGIGKAIAQGFAANGAKLMLAARNEETLAAVTKELGGNDNGVHYICMDMKDAASIQQAIEKTVSIFGRLDVAVNNAGIQSPRMPFVDFDEAQYDEVMSVNVRGMFIAMKHQIRAMLKNESGGSIVNVSSIAGMRGIPFIAPYVASKHAVIGLTKSVASEYAAQKVRVNVIVPGTIQTDLFAQGPGATPESTDMIKNNVPMGRIAEANEVASAAVWLCSDTASYVTGVTLPVDGGFVL